MSPQAIKKSAIGQRIVAILPYIRQEIPIMIVFRALGFVADRDILEHVIYDFDDQEMMEMIKPSLDEAFVIQEQNIALNFIGSRGARPGVTKERRIKYAREILQKETLPHVGVSDFCETKKAYFLGYMVHRLLSAALGRREIGMEISLLYTLADYTWFETRADVFLLMGSRKDIFNLE